MATRVVDQLLLPTLRNGNGKRRSIIHPGPPRRAERDGVSIFHEYAESLYDDWPEPVCIIVDGPYGVAGFPGDPPTHNELPDWYRPHIEAWSRRATPLTTLWFWGTEIGWATVHPLLVEYGWEYRNCHIWNKGLGHVAGNANSQTLRKFPVVTEVCVQYVKRAEFVVGGAKLTMQEWLRHEWQRSGLPFYRANEACGVANAATRKYLTGDHLWYYPPVDAFERMAAYLNKHGRPEGRPYLSIDGRRPMTGEEWSRMRAKFYCDVGVTNVWTEPPIRGSERVKSQGCKVLHANQKPLKLCELIVRACTDEGDVVWEPFGGLCTGAIAAHKLGRRCVSAEIDPTYFFAAAERLATYDE